MQVSRTRPEPLYHQVVDEIRQHIASGRWSPGERVPSERQLAEILGVSRITVRHAVRLAVEAGLLEQRPGVGTFVREPGRLRQDLSEVRTFELTLAEQGLVASTQILHSGPGINNLAITGALHLDSTEPLYNLRLLGRGDSTPVALYDSSFALPLGRELAGQARRLAEDGRPFSTLDLYREGPISRRPTALSQTIEALAAPADLAAHLEIPPATPVVAVESVMTDQRGPLEFRRAYYRADRYKFVVSRPIAPLFPSS